jgi:hypothetical protein
VEVFGVLARTASVDYLRPLIEGLGPRSSIEVLLPVAIAPVIEAAHFNTVAAIAALQRGDSDSAKARLGEVAAVGLRLLEIPMLAPYAYRMLRGEALSPLAALAEAEGRPEEARSLRAARAALTSLGRGAAALGSAGLAAEAPDMSRLARIVLHGSLPMGDRVSLLMNAWGGLCGNPREIVAGPSPARDQRLLALADSTGSVHARALVFLARRRWAQTLDAQGGDAGFLAAVENRGPAAIARRLLRCTEGIHGGPL